MLLFEALCEQSPREKPFAESRRTEFVGSARAPRAGAAGGNAI
jgi:hypothetical protein